MASESVADDELQRQVSLRTRELEEQVRLLTRQKKTAEKANQAKNQFILDMGHDLHSPLNSILGYTQLLLKDAHLDKKQRQGVEVIQNSGNNLLQMIDDIIDLAKIDKGELTFQTSEFILTHLIEEISVAINHKAQSRGFSFQVTMDTNIQKELVVKGDRHRLEQAILNLLYQKMKTGSRINLNISRGENTANINAPEITIIFTITLTGGLNASLDTGLVISRQLLELMGGRIHETSSNGPSFRVEITFPVVSEPVGPDSDTAMQTLPSSGKGKIMVVDDVMANRMVIHDMLASQGFTILEADSGQDALDKVTGFEPDLVMLDLMMPGLNGFETLLKIRQLSAPAGQAKVILLTGQTSDKMFKKCFENGADDYIAKPIKFDLMMEKVCHLLNIKEEGLPELLPVKKDEIFPPTQELLKLLFNCIDKYDYDSMLSILADLEETDNKYAPFARRIQAFASEFLQQQIIEFLQKYMHQPDNEPY